MAQKPAVERGQARKQQESRMKLTGHANGLTAKVQNLGNLRGLRPVAVGVVTVQHGADNSRKG